MLNLSKLHPQILADLRASLAHPTLSPEQLDAELSRLNPRDALDFFLRYHGIANWTDTIVLAVVSIDNAIETPSLVTP